MIAHGAYISDADWHGIYDRAKPVGTTKPVFIKDNVWIGDSAIICKGVTIGKNSIIGAGSVVTKDVERHSLIVGNPGRHVGWVSHIGEKLDLPILEQFTRENYNFLPLKKPIFVQKSKLTIFQVFSST